MFVVRSLGGILLQDLTEPKEKAMNVELICGKRSQLHNWRFQLFQKLYGYLCFMEHKHNA